MSWLDGLRHRVRTVLHPVAFEAELYEEMRAHQQMDAERADGTAARNRFGNETWYREETRRMTWLGMLDTWRQDAGYATRGIVRAPGVTAVVVVTLALGIGVNAAVFALLDRIYLRTPGGVSTANEVRRVWVQHVNTSDGVPFAVQGLNYPMVRVVQDAIGRSDDVAVYTGVGEARLGPEAGAPTARRVYASSNLFTLLGVSLLRGRFYTAAEDVLGAGAKVAVISERFWRRHFGSDPDVLGRTLTLGTETFTVIGVTERAFTGLELQPADVWLPLGTYSILVPGPGPWWESTNMYALHSVLRVPTAAAATAFEERATAQMRNFNRMRDASDADTLMRVYAGSIIEARGPGVMSHEIKIAARLGGVSAIVLLIACANVIHMLLVRALQRSRETAVRLALGISRWRMMRLVWLETLLLAVLAGGAALLAAWWGGTVLRTLLLPDIEWTTPAFDTRVALFTMVITLLAGTVAAIVPAIQSGRATLMSAMRGGARGGMRQRSHIRSGLVIVQAALSVVLLIGATLFVRSLRNVQTLDIGYDPPGIIFGKLTFGTGDAPSRAVLAAELQDIEQRLEQRRGIEAVARATMRPMSGFTFINFFVGNDSMAGLGSATPTMIGVSPDYFRAAGLRITKGNGFSSGEASEIVVNEAMARRVWRDREPLGKCVRFESRNGACYRVVGVVENAARSELIEEERAAQYYLPLGNMPTPFYHGTVILVRADPRAADLARAALQSELARAFPRALSETTPMMEYIEPLYRPWRLGASLFTAFGVLALLVAIVGIYTTVSYTVTQRTHEFGVRMTLGARVTNVLLLVLAEGLRTVVLGVLAGIVLAIAAGRLIAALLHGVEPHDPITLAIVTCILLVVASVAAMLPAWRAARLNPVTTLRGD
jgi:putative ABC transport system permease protein